jgi:nucleoid-associated protein YgaU
MLTNPSGGLTARKWIIPAALLVLALLVFLGWRGVFAPQQADAPSNTRSAVAEAPLGSAAPGNAGQAARPVIPAAPVPPDLAAPAAEAPRSEAAANASARNEAARSEAAPAGASAAAQPAMEPPRFDVVRVGARGSAVIAGRAAPGAEVIVMADNGRELGRARADRRGEFVILPADPLPPGNMELSLVARLGDQEVRGPDTVVLVVPDTAAQMAEAGRASREAAQSQDQQVQSPAERTSRDAAPSQDQQVQTAAPAQPTGPLAVLVPMRPEGTAPRVLQGGEAASPERAASRLSIDSVEYDQGGAMIFAGSAQPGAVLRLYINDLHAGDATADMMGRWSLMPETQPAVGRHRLRVDQISPAEGRVLARAEVPFQREELPNELLAQQRIVVQPGHNLWRIARATYGRGTRYTVIYQANRDQIADPNRIFPGQVFALPAASPAPEASNRPR